jgi:hypothetical protein
MAFTWDIAAILFEGHLKKVLWVQWTNLLTIIVKMKVYNSQLERTFLISSLK